jgi:hypothetical protein
MHVTLIIFCSFFSLRKQWDAVSILCAMVSTPTDDVVFSLLQNYFGIFLFCDQFLCMCVSQVRGY